jgi:hypothetical protein
MEVLGDIVDDYWVIGLIILGIIIWADRSAKQNVKQGKQQKVITMEENKEIEGEGANTSNQPSLGSSIYNNLLSVPVWALYFLIISTVVLTVLILTKIWFPEVFVDDFFARILMSYAALMVSTYVIAKMSEAIKEVKK